MNGPLPHFLVVNLIFSSKILLDESENCFYISGLVLSVNFDEKTSVSRLKTSIAPKNSTPQPMFTIFGLI